MGVPVYYGLGIFFLALYILATVVFSQTVQLLGTGQEGKWSKPYFEAWAYHAVWVIVFPFAYLVYYIEKRRSKLGDQYPKIPYRQFIIWYALCGSLLLSL